MSVVALIAWIVTAMGGLYLLAIWLIEYDPDFQRAAATRLPVPVVCGHVLFAVGGLAFWVMYLITNKRVFCLTAACDLVLIAALGVTMAVRWLGVYRARPGQAPARAVPVTGGPPLDPAAWTARTASEPDWPAATTSPSSQARPSELAVPPERHFPVSVVIAHGVFALTTVTLVVLTAAGIGAG